MTIPTPPEPSRADLSALARRLLLALRPYTSPGRARIVPPYGPAGYGLEVCGLEGYARTAMLAAMLVAGQEGDDPDGFLESYAEGLAAGVDPGHSERWVRPSEHPQAVVECFPLALTLELSRPWLWDRLSSRTQEQVIAYLAEARAQTIPDNNWLWFVVTAETFLRSVGADSSEARVTALLERSEHFYAGDGWYRDGDGRQFDHYNDFAWHAIPLVWSTMRGAEGLADELAPRYHERARLFLEDARHLIGGDGGPLVQGRSLVYRFAIAAPFWAAAFADVQGLDPGMLRRCASAIVGHFVEHDALDAEGVLSLGWYRRWPRLVQSYSSTGSPYWASLGLMGLALPDSHPLWNAPSVPLPIEVDSYERLVPQPGWLVSGLRTDGVVRVVNHGTDHGRQGDLTTEPPLYARLGYSTATWPVLDDHLGTRDQSVAVLDRDCLPSDRSGIETLWLRDDAGALHGASRWQAHWVDAATGQGHGGPAAGSIRLGPWLTVASVVRDAVEVRCVAVDGATALLSISGWAVGEGSDHRSTVDLLAQRGAALGRGLWTLGDTASPVAAGVCVPHLEGRSDDGGIAVVAVQLNGTGEPLPLASIDARRVTVRWPDGHVDTVQLPRPGE